MAKTESQLSADQALININQRRLEIVEQRKKMGLPDIDAVALQKEYQNKPIPKDIDDLVDNFFDSLPK